MTRRALVDGAGGFLGRHVVRALRERGFWVRATDLAAPDDGDERVACDLAVDPLDPLFAGITHAVHVAGLFDLAASPSELRRANVDAAVRVAEAAARARVERFVHVSSTTVYGRPRRPASESAPIRPQGAYERSKAAGEDAVRAVALPLAVVRPAGIYGPHGRYGLAALAPAVALAAAGSIRHRSLRPTASMTHVHVEDAASACALALEHPEAVGRTFNAADATPLAWSDALAEMERFYHLAEVAPLRVAPWRATAMQWAGRLAPSRVARASAALAKKWDALVQEQGLAPALRPRIDLAAYDYWKGDHVFGSAALRALGWQPRWTDPRAGLRATLEWYVRERWLPTPRRPA
jgi:UDP-glucose 4-epimerase